MEDIIQWPRRLHKLYNVCWHLLRNQLSIVQIAALYPLLAAMAVGLVVYPAWFADEVTPLNTTYRWWYYAAQPLPLLLVSVSIAVIRHRRWAAVCVVVILATALVLGVVAAWRVEIFDKTLFEFPIATVLGGLFRAGLLLLVGTLGTLILLMQSDTFWSAMRHPVRPTEVILLLIVLNVLTCACLFVATRVGHVLVYTVIAGLAVPLQIMAVLLSRRDLMNGESQSTATQWYRTQHKLARIAIIVTIIILTARISSKQFWAELGELRAHVSEAVAVGNKDWYY